MQPAGVSKSLTRSVPIQLMAYRSGPARSQADSNTGPQRSLKVIGSSRADFPSWPGAPKTLLTEAVDMFAV